MNEPQYSLQRLLYLRIFVVSDSSGRIVDYFNYRLRTAVRNLSNIACTQLAGEVDAAADRVRLLANVDKLELLELEED